MLIPELLLFFFYIECVLTDDCASTNCNKLILTIELCVLIDVF